jgi:hypothetical protein
MLAAALTVGAACARTGTPPPSGTSPTAGSASPSPTGATPSPTGPRVTCSATGLAAEPAAQQLPEKVAQMRSKIVAAAVACDYRTLESLALEGDGTFSFSFGGGTSPAEYWEETEKAGSDEPMRQLVQTMNLPHFAEKGTVSTTDPARVTLYVWPRAHRAEATDADWKAVEPLYGAETIRKMREGGSGFLGYRAAITESGDWTYFIAGD